MRMNRRNVLAGIGALTAGGGAIFGSGAFSQVQADRSMTFETNDDNNANLEMVGNDGYTTTNGGQIEFTFNQLNDNAKSTFTGVLDITPDPPSPSDGEEYEVHIVADDANNLEVGGGALNFQDASDSSSIVGETNAASLSYSSGSWDSLTVDIVVDLTVDGVSASDLPTEITIQADEIAQ